MQRDNGLYTYFASGHRLPPEQSTSAASSASSTSGAPTTTAIFRASRGALAALELDPDVLDVALVQFAVLYRNGQKASMSTRSGEFVTLRTLRDEVGNDACRFFYVLQEVRPAPRLRPRPRQEPDQRESGLLHPVRARPPVLGLRAVGWRRGEPEQGRFARLTSPYELAVAAKLGEFPKSSNRRRASWRRTWSLSTSRIWRPSSTATTTPNACSSTTPRSRKRVSRLPARCVRSSATAWPSSA